MPGRQRLQGQSQYCVSEYEVNAWDIEKLTLVVRNFVTGLVNASKAEVTILAHLAILRTVDDHRLVSCGLKLFAVRVVHCQTDGFTAEPVAWDALAKLKLKT